MWEDRRFERECKESRKEINLVNGKCIGIEENKLLLATVIILGIGWQKQCNIPIRLTNG
jgi:hypothetical protein